MFLQKHFGVPSRHPHAERELRDVVENLEAMMRARRGASSFHPLYGLATQGFRTPEELVSQLGAQVRENVETFEPRLRITRIEESYDEAYDETSVLVTCEHKVEPYRVRILANAQRVHIALVSKARGPR